ncbi:hypothetical protein B0H66DRAFT_568267 [Apodospora peruviana]|uniref:WSC domain-containing protein n=1 Tax=Apodospora peruviana TaxID=516989 RepID=A0AAE0HXG4_9PEZI|nr:hypothetical protein B0H66DRAFT_568267 [Apodospora peruviana]
MKQPHTFLATTLLVSISHSSTAMEFAGCYSEPGELINNGTYMFQSIGYCRDRCLAQEDISHMALEGGNRCYCGTNAPPARAIVESSNCSLPCVGYALETCGGDGFWQVYLI